MDDLNFLLDSKMFFMFLFHFLSCTKKKVSKINVIYIFHISKADNFRLQFEKHTRANPFINQPFGKIQKFFDRNYSYMLQIQKKLKNPENVESGLQNPDPEFRKILDLKFS